MIDHFYNSFVCLSHLEKAISFFYLLEMGLQNESNIIFYLLDICFEILNTNFNVSLSGSMI